MPLIDLQTNLKSLKFPGRAPYVTKDINQPPVYNAVGHELRARVDDVTRLTKMLTDTPGLQFIAKQALLQASNPANFNSNKNTVIGRAADTAGSIVKNTARTVGTVLAQAAVNRTGTHFILQSPDYYYTAESAGQLIAAGATEITPSESRRSPLEARVAEVTPKRHTNVDFKSTDEKYTKDNITIRTARESQTKTLAESLDSKYGFAGANRVDKVGRYDIQQSIPENVDTVPIIFGEFNGTGATTDYKIFRGFLGNLADNFTANWAGNSYVGRMEQFFVYTGFSRSVSFSFTVPIFSVSEQASVYNKINALVSHTAPKYANPGSGIPQGIITDLQVGDYLNTPGVLNSVSVTVNNDVPWSYGEGEKPMMLPQVLELQIQFTPIHKKTPQYHNSTLTTQEQQMPYIANKQGVKTSTLAQTEVAVYETLPEPPTNIELDAITLQGETVQKARLEEVIRAWLRNRKARVPKAPRELTAVIEVGDGQFIDIDNEFTSL